jgi:hypothetical protein
VATARIPRVKKASVDRLRSIMSSIPSIGLSRKKFGESASVAAGGVCLADPLGAVPERWQIVLVVVEHDGNVTHDED